MSTITTQGKTFTVQDVPVGLGHAIANADENGEYKAVLVFDQREFINTAYHGLDDFYDYIVEKLMEGSASGSSYTILGVADDHLIVEVSNSIIDLMSDGWADLWAEVDTETLVAAVDRFSGRGPAWDISGVQAELNRRTAE